MRAQIVPEREMALDVGVAALKDTDLVRAVFATLAKIAASRYAIFSQPLIAKVRQGNV